MNGIGAGALRALLLLLPLLSAPLGQESLCDQKDFRTIYQFREELLDGSRNVSLAEFLGKLINAHSTFHLPPPQVVLIVNVATYARTAFETYPQLNALQTHFRDDLVVLGFPCNQFGMVGIASTLIPSLNGLENMNFLEQREPGRDGVEIINGLTHVRPGVGFAPNFVLFRKVDVNGSGRIPLYSFLTVSLLPSTLHPPPSILLHPSSTLHPPPS
ncbi:unnamed protein product, partial [Darwinula stevensoni]